MQILLTGATGFIGRHLMAALLAAGHRVRGVSRRTARSSDPRVEWLALDFSGALDPADWHDALKDVDVIINAVGIFRESAAQKFDVVHTVAPCALFVAAAQAGIPYVIQISALGADAGARSRYHTSKKAADDCLLGTGLAATIVQPSLVYGPGGASARLFGMFASMPVIALPGRGEQPIQPVHIDDLVDAIVALVDMPAPRPVYVSAVGPAPTTLRRFYADLRASMGIGKPPLFLPIPMSLMVSMATVANRLPGGFLDTETLAMLERGNTGDVRTLRTLLRRPPRPPREFVEQRTASAIAAQSRLTWLLPVLRISLAVVWIVTGIVSLGLYPVADSLELLRRAGVPPALGPLFLYGASAFDLVLGVLTLLPRRPAFIWRLQAGLILLYTVIITIKLPEFWLHPYGPILKNIPMLAVLWMLGEMEGGRWTISR